MKFLKAKSFGFLFKKGIIFLCMKAFLIICFANLSPTMKPKLCLCNQNKHLQLQKPNFEHLFILSNLD